VSDAAKLPALSGDDVRVVRAEPLVEALRHGRIGDFQALSPFAACLMPLLSALGWRGDPRHVVEALPHFAPYLDLDGLRNVLAELSFVSRPEAKKIADVDARLMPCLHVDTSGTPRVLLERVEGKVRVFDGHLAGERLIRGREIAGTAYLIEIVEPGKDEAAASTSFMATIGRRFLPVAWQLALITLLTDTLTLAFPLFSMVIYDKVIGHDARDLLIYLLVGVGSAIGFDMALRLVRARLLAYVGARVERLVAVAVLRQLMRLPVGFTESAPIGAQLARLKEFDSIREFFTGPLAGVALDLPFLFVFLIVIAVLGGPLVFVPLGLGLVVVLLGAVVAPAQKDTIARASRARAQRHGLMVEIVSNLRAIKSIGGSEIWLERFRALSAASAIEGYKSQRIATFTQTVSQGLMMAAGTLVLVIGAIRIVDEAMTVGALVATMALVWRVLAPLQLGLVTLQRVEQIRLGILQIDQLLKLKPELQERGAGSVVQRVFRGAISLNRVSLRYRQDAEPALLGVELAIKPGEMVGLAGASGAGKSTALKVLAGLYQPQAGSVLLDGLDIRQMTPAELRLAVSYAPQNRHLFHGTIAQNLRLAASTASEEDLRRSLDEAGALEDVLGLRDGLATGLGDLATSAIPAGLLQRIALARIYLRPSAVLLLDEPGQWLDEAGDAALMRALRARKGKQTIVMVTHRPSHLAICDRVVTLDAGRIAQIRAAGTAPVAAGGPRA